VPLLFWYDQAVVLKDAYHGFYGLSWKAQRGSVAQFFDRSAAGMVLLRKLSGCSWQLLQCRLEAINFMNQRCFP
jgi:hypothetical protein